MKMKISSAKIKITLSLLIGKSTLKLRFKAPQK